ncbi:pro-FMRFamide-related neuropeptide VF [Notolabrus celidotus]|uniref:pro-FMRFamide-related neuropeptide VF n=1 Tax=Notolabrus celidotus TaxID=1203425 RepID=UPI00148F74D7|nr:pro-FMRFamide-related neuropeptide VF [Notolabrus celidotus]
MSITVFLSVLLMLGGLGGAVTTDLRVFGKSAHGGKSLLSSGDGRHVVRKYLHQQTKSDSQRSLDIETFNIHSTPPSKISLPSIVKLYPPTARPLHLHANMPMRFGRQSSSSEDRGQKSTPNMPQRFGRAWETVQMCAGCPKVRGVVNTVLPQRFGRSSLYWLLKTMVNDQLPNNGMHWSKDVDLTASSEEMETQDKSFKE